MCGMQRYLSMFMYQPSWLDSRGPQIIFFRKRSIPIMMFTYLILVYGFVSPKRSIPINHSHVFLEGSTDIYRWGRSMMLITRLCLFESWCTVWSKNGLCNTYLLSECRLSIDMPKHRWQIRDIHRVIVIWWWPTWTMAILLLVWGKWGNIRYVSSYSVQFLTLFSCIDLAETNTTSWGIHRPSVLRLLHRRRPCSRPWPNKQHFRPRL